MLSGNVVGGLRKCPVDKKEELNYLTELLILMIKEDQDSLGLNAVAIPNSSFEYIRFLPTISAQFSNPKGKTHTLAYMKLKILITLASLIVKTMKADFEAKIGDLSAPVDDPVFVELNAKFLGAILYDFETRASRKLYRVSAIQFVRSYASNRLSCWEATCEPVYRDTSTGLFHVPADQRVNDSKVIKTTALQGYALAEYPNGLDKDPSYLPWVQQYITHFSDVIQPRYNTLLARKVKTKPMPFIYY